MSLSELLPGGMMYCTIRRCSTSLYRLLKKAVGRAEGCSTSGPYGKASAHFEASPFMNSTAPSGIRVQGKVWLQALSGGGASTTGAGVVVVVVMIGQGLVTMNSSTRRFSVTTGFPSL